MKPEKRLVFLELANEINCCICTWCKYADWETEGCCEGYHICAHPIEKVCELMEEIEPGGDCWAFQPCHHHYWHKPMWVFDWDKLNHAIAALLRGEKT